MKHPFSPFLAIAIALLTACNQNAPSSQTVALADTVASQADTAAIKQAIREKTNRFTQAHITGDTAFLNSIFASDARILAPNYGMATGRMAIAALNAQWVGYGIKEFREESFAFYGEGNYFIDEGNYTLRFGPDNQLDMGKYMNVWKKENGDWKIGSNIWNTSLPAVQ